MGFSTELKNGLVAFWPGDEASGNMLDSHVNELDLTDNNAVPHSPGLVYPLAREFASTLEQNFTRNSSSPLVMNPGDSFTLACWAYVNAHPAGGLNYGGFCGKSATHLFHQEYHIGISSIGVDDNFSFNLGQFATGAQQVLAENFGQVPLDEWVLVIGWYDGGTSTMYIQVNNTTPDSFVASEFPQFLDGPFWVGGPIESAGGDKAFADARVSPVMLWNRTLTVDEHTELWNGGTGLKLETEIVGKRDYDIYLDGKGYFLLKTQAGTFQSGASQWRSSDPFTRQLSEEGRRSKQTFGFSGGAGCREYDGTDRYYYGENVDTRSGGIQIGPEWEERPASVDPGEYISESWPAWTDIPAGGQAAVHLYTVDANYGNHITLRDLRCIGIMLSADGYEAPNFWQAGDIDDGFVHVELWTGDETGPTAIVVGGEAEAQIDVPPGNSRPWELYGEDGNAAWYECLFDADISSVQEHWVVVRNESTAALRWPHAAPLKGSLGFPRGRYYATRPTDVAAWTVTDSESGAGVDDPRRYPVVKTRPADGIDGFVREVMWFGSTFGTHTLVAAGNKVFRWDPDTGTLGNIANPLAGGFDEVVLDLYSFTIGDKKNEAYVVYAGFRNGDIYYWDGDLADTVWVQLPSDATYDNIAHRFGEARNLFWRSKGSQLGGVYEVKLNEGWNTAFDWIIGWPTTPILAIESGFEGTVLVLKPEGIYSVYVPDGYPAADLKLYGDLVVDLTGEAVGRGFLEFWTDAAYFPLDYGLGEYRSSAFRDTWVRREDEGGDLVTVDAYDPYYGRFVAMSPNARSSWLAKGAAYPDGYWDDWINTVSPPERSRGLEIWAWDGRGFHQAVTERRYYVEQCQTCFQLSMGRGLARIFYGHGFHLRAYTIPSWTQDKAQGDPGQEFNTYDPLKNDTLPQPSDWYAGGDPPHLIMPLFYGDGLDTDKTWTGVEVHYDQVNLQYPVLFDMWIRWFDGQDWLELTPVDPSTAAADWGGGTKQFTVPQDTSGATPIDPISPWCQLAIRFDTTTYDANAVASNVNNIKVAGIDLVYDAHPESIVQYEIVLAIGDYQQLHNAARDNRTAKDQVTELRALLETKKTFNYIDVWGETYEVRAMGMTDQPYRQMPEAPNYGKGFRIESVVGYSLLFVEWPP